jgi:hypothetical protein
MRRGGARARDRMRTVTAGVLAILNVIAWSALLYLAGA